MPVKLAGFLKDDLKSLEYFSIIRFVLFAHLGLYLNGVLRKLGEHAVTQCRISKPRLVARVTGI